MKFGFSAPDQGIVIAFGNKKMGEIWKNAI